MRLERLNKPLLATGALITPFLILAEQVVHLSPIRYPNIRYVFGQFIGDHIGNATLGVAAHFANKFGIGLLRDMNLSERRVFQMSAVFMGAALGFIISNEYFSLIGTPQLLDPFAYVLAVLSCTCADEYSQITSRH